MGRREDDLRVDGEKLQIAVILHCAADDIFSKCRNRMKKRILTFESRAVRYEEISCHRHKSTRPKARCEDSG